MLGAAKTNFDILIPKPQKLVVKNKIACRLPVKIGLLNEFTDMRVFKQVKRTFANRRIVAGDFLRIKKVTQLKGNEAYELEITPGYIEIRATAAVGAFHALSTLAQLSRGCSLLPCGIICDWPDLKFRGMHIMTGWRCVPTIDALKLMISSMSDLKYNKLVLEYDEQLPNWKYGRMPPYTVKEIHELNNFARDHFIELIPLLDSLGHMNSYLRPKKYAHLREQPNKITELCPQNPESMRFVKSLWQKALRVHPKGNYAHISGDEVFRVTPCKKCRPFKEQNRQGELYRNYYTDLSRWMIKQGKQAIIWGDMLIKRPNILRNFPRDIIVCYWDYTGTQGDLSAPYMRYIEGRQNEELLAPYWKPNKTGAYDPFPYLRFFGDQGFKTIAGSTSMCSYNKDNWPVFLSPIAFYNNMRFALEAEKQKKTCLGLLSTTWCQVVPGFWFGAVAGGDFSWNARTETFEQFIQRFAAGFLCRSDWSESILQITNAQEGKSTIVPDLKGSPGQGATVMAMEFTRLLKFTINYMKLVMAKRTENGLIFKNAVRGRAKPLDLSKVGNCELKNALPICSRRFPAKSGNYDFYGLPFKLDANHIIRLRSKGIKSATVPVKQKIEGLLFWTVPYNAWPNKVLAKMNVYYENAADETFEFVGDLNLLDWSALHKTPKDKKSCVVAWRGRKDTSGAICSWLTYWRNPHPDKVVKMINISSCPVKGKKETFLVFLGISKIESKPLPEKCSSSVPSQKITIERLKIQAEKLYSRWVKKAYLKRTVQYQLNNLQK